MADTSSANVTKKTCVLPLSKAEIAMETTGLWKARKINILPLWDM